jgi:hypothetical protein
MMLNSKKIKGKIDTNILFIGVNQMTTEKGYLEFFKVQSNLKVQNRYEDGINLSEYLGDTGFIKEDI